MTTRLSVILPVYNESQHIVDVVGRVLRAEVPAGVTKQIIVVDDGSTDGGHALLERLAREERVEVYRLERNQGKGAAIRHGLRFATGEVVLIQDADLEYSPAEYRPLIEPLMRDGAAVVYGSRFRGTIRGMRWSNWLANKLLVSLANVLYGAGITDEATGFKVFRRDVLLRLDLRCRRFEFCPEVTAKLCRAGYVIREVPISYDGRSAKQGKKVRWHDGVVAVWTLARYRFWRPRPIGLEDAHGRATSSETSLHITTRNTTPTP